MRAPTAIAVVDAGYDLTGSDQQWVEGIARSAARLAPEGPLVATLLRREPSSVRKVARASHPLDAELLAMTERIEARIPPEVQKFYSLRSGCETASEFASATFGPLGPEMMDALYHDTLYPLGKRDLFNVQGADPSGFSIWLTFGTTEVTTVHPRVRHTWQRVATHLLAALRLRLALRGAVALDEADAVLSPDGRLAHARGGASEKSARDVLREAAVAVDRARSSLASPEEALELWQGLFAGRWTLCEVFDTDGRRYYVALENEPGAIEDRRLTRREGQVVALVALGQGLDDAAYASGLSVSTVRTHLDRALVKLGLGSPFQLIAFAGQLLGAHAPR